MLAVGLGIIWGGFLLASYGRGIMQHRQLTLLDFAVPGYFAKHGGYTGEGVIYVPSPSGPPPSGAPVAGQNPVTGQTAPPPGWHLVTLPNGDQVMQGP